MAGVKNDVAVGSTDLERELVLQRFEAADEEFFNVEGSLQNPFEPDTYTTARKNELKSIEKVYKSMTDTAGRGSDSLSRTHAAEFFSRIAKSGFFGKSRAKKHIKADDIREILNFCLKDQKGNFTLDTLTAACYAWRDKGGITYPGEESFDTHLEKHLKMNKEEEFEFRTAFSVVAGSKTISISTNDTITEDQVDDVMLALGFSFTDADIATMVMGCDLDSSSKITCDSLLASYEATRDNQIHLKQLKALYCSLIRDDVLHNNIPHECKGKVVGTTPLMLSALRNAVNKALMLNGPMALTENEVMPMVEEISASPERKISFEDFVRLFSSGVSST